MAEGAERREPEPAAERVEQLAEPAASGEAREADDFALFGLPRRLLLDPAELEARYHALSRQFHPDRSRAATPRERRIALERAARLNQAYRRLRDPFERAAYLLRLETGGDQGERPQPAGAAPGVAGAPPRELFEEILEIQELLGDWSAAGPEERAALRHRLEARREELHAEQERRAGRLAGELFPHWDALETLPGPERAAERQRLLAEMSRLLDERAYLRRVLNRLDDALAEP